MRAGRYARSACKVCERTASKQWRAENSDRVRKAQKKYYEANKDRLKYLSSVQWRRRRYGVSDEQYNEMLKRQHGRCAVCGGKPEGRWELLNVDHDHKTGRTRGLLCGPCNRGLGQLRDDPNLLMRAHSYLMEYA